MRIGNIDFGEQPLFLAPMEEVTDGVFRRLCKHYGADMVYTEFVSSDALIRKVEKSLKKMTFFDEERPIGIQIYGNQKDAMVEAARIAESMKPELIDINFGCPVKKIARRGAGSGMMNNVPLMVEITEAIVKAVKLPVTVKTRLGYDAHQKNIVEIAERLQDVGIQAITIHGRTRDQMYTGTADWTLIGEVKNNPRMHIPVIGNGDIDSPTKAKECFDKYGVDAIMIGRATIGHPYIFSHIKHYLSTGQILPEPGVKEVVAIVRRHIAMAIASKGERSGILHLRRHFAQYFKNLPHFRETRIRLLTATTEEQVHEILNEIEEKWGEEMEFV
ncbi:MAG: tRNA dihydrouridine synthase DusB [Bacteroidales bacterium]|nr:tRNA dihydrouridine synthase DusB [Bacteroidales bacterium]